MLEKVISKRINIRTTIKVWCPSTITDFLTSPYFFFALTTYSLGHQLLLPPTDCPYSS